jgi:UDP-2-acetamido-3-amino-2,3-dideoxy-glucuronate N-acetyltransferase
MIVPTAFVHESAYVDEGCKIGAGTKIWHFVHILTETVIGKNCSLGQNVTAGPGVTIGDDCKIQNNVSIYKGVTLEQNVFCGPSCVFTNGLTPCANINRKDEFSKTLVRRGCTIGANVTIVCDNTLKEYCMISAGAVVTSDVPAFALMVGVPTKRVGWVSRASDRHSDDLMSQRTGEKYEINDEELR